MNLLWSAILALQAAIPPNDPSAVVREYFEGMKALDAERANAVLADDYRLVDSDGSSRLHNRALGYVITEWEKGVHARWSYRILSERGDTVTALLEEESDYFTLLGLERSIQVRSYIVRDGKILQSFGHLYVTAKSSQAVAVQQFKSWLRATVSQPDPALIGPAGNLLLTKESAQPMIYWMGRWRAEVDSAKNRR